jgi:hypothetical protein
MEKRARESVMEGEEDEDMRTGVGDNTRETEEQQMRERKEG